MRNAICHGDACERRLPEDSMFMGLCPTCWAEACERAARDCEARGDYKAAAARRALA